MTQKLTRAQERIMLEQARILDKNVLRVLRVAEKLDRRNSRLAWLRKEIDMGSQADPVFIMEKVKIKISDFADRIFARDEEFFKNTDAFFDEKYVKNDSRREFMVSFIRMIQVQISTVPETQKGQIWDYLIELTQAIHLYRHTDPNDPFQMNMSSEIKS